MFEENQIINCAGRRHLEFWEECLEFMEKLKICGGDKPDANIVNLIKCSCNCVEFIISL